MVTGVAAAVAADPSALWTIVNGKCVPHVQQTGDPAPCAAVDPVSGFAILKDRVGATQFLLIPTARISGMEDPAILTPSAPNFWEPAWKARGLMDEPAHTILPRDVVSLAINSMVGRSQDQLHIHIDCVRGDVRDALAANQAKIGAGWSRFPTPLAGHTYRAMRVEQPTLEGVDPFRLLAAGDPTAISDMGMHTLVVVGMTFADGKDGFAVLDTRADLTSSNRASGEELQDHDCAAVRHP